MALGNDTGLKQDRKFRAHYLGTVLAATATTASADTICRIGRGINDLSRSLSWNTTAEKDVTGVVDATSTRGDEALTVDPYYCRKDSPITAMLQEIDEKNYELDNVKHWYYEAKVDDTGATMYAFKQLADVKPTGFGGAADNADAIPFELTLSGEKIPMDFVLASETFTEKA
jgi:hypothetical protein